MKKVFAMVLFCVFFASCDDGDLTVDTIDFSTVNAASCENLIYKVSSNEALIIQLPTLQAAIINDPTLESAPRIFEINGTTTRVIYRSYDGTISGSSFCASVPPANPVVQEEWTASSGTIEISTFAVKTANANLEGGEKITGYRHQIIFRNITFDKPDGSQLYEVFNFGNYNTTTPNLSFTFTAPADRCDSGRLYNWTSTESIILDNFDNSLLANEVTPLDQPRTALLGTESNILTFSVFGGGLSSSYFCANPQPVTPEPIQVWSGAPGIPNVSGVIEVHTTTTSGGFIHEIHLRNATLRSGNSEFILADDFLFGTIITNN